MPDGPFDVLLRVQDLDTHIAQLRHRRQSLAERGELDALEARLAEMARRTADLSERRQALLARQAEIEARVASVEDRRHTIEQRLYTDRGSAARDLQAMTEEVRHLAAHRSELEDAELALMEEQEPLDAELEALSTEQATVAEAAGTLRSSLEEAEAAIDAELAEAEPARAAEAAKLSPDLAARYEQLRAHLKGTGAARLVGNRCDGCHLELPSVEVDRIRHLPPDEVVTCDQCGRILVRASA